MRVAIAGAGSFAKYFAEEFPKAGHEVVILTRSHKDFFDGKPGVLEQRITDYQSIPQLVELLKDCDALVSTIASMDRSLADSQLALIEACKQTPKCKRFIPAEFFHNSEKFPEPDRLHPYNKMITDNLEAQDDLEWTVVSMQWVMDYVVPSTNRYHADVEGVFPLDMKTSTLTVPGSGNDAFALTSVRDVAKAIATILKSPAKWRHHTYVQGEETTWLQVAKILTAANKVGDLKTVFASVEELQELAKCDEPVWTSVMAELSCTLLKGKCALTNKRFKVIAKSSSPICTLPQSSSCLKKWRRPPTTIV